MKDQKKNKKNIFKKIFIKICRFLDFEIIDQNSYSVPTSFKKIGDNLSVPGIKSITLPLGKLNITRKVKSLKIIFKSCTSELILDQNKKRLFCKQKNEYTFRSLSSLLKSISKAKEVFKDISFDIVITDTNSPKIDIDKIKYILSRHSITNELLEINLNSLKNVISDNVSEAKFATMANYYTSLNLAKNSSADLIYMVEDDYIHTDDSISEMLFTFEKLSTILKNEIFLLPTDYPYLYTKSNSTKIFLGHEKHWRLVEESLGTFMTSKILLLENFDKLIKMSTNWSDPFEKPLHDIYTKTPCFSPIPSLAMHCSNVNSSYGLSPNLDWKKIWDSNEDY